MTHRERIDALYQLNKSLEAMKEEEARLAKPLLTDISLIQIVYNIFCAVRGNDAQEISERRVFLFVVLYLYSPRTLSGERRMTNGMRNEIVRVLPFLSPCAVSYNIRNLGFYFDKYKTFRTKVLGVLAEVDKTFELKS